MSTSLVKSSGTAIQGVDSLEFQFDMFRKHKLQVTMAERYKFVPRDGGTFALVKRESPVSIFDDGDHGPSIAATARTYSDRVGLSASRGKYNDESRLLNDAMTVKVGEVAAWATI